MPGNSDSFPGLLALVTGGSPASTGIFYDVSYDRTFFAPGNTSCTGVPGTTVTFDETIDRYGADHVSLDVIDPATLPRRLDSDGRCVPVYPHDALRTNTIFEVVREAGGRTSDMRGGVHSVTASEHLLADNGLLHDEVLAMFEKVFDGNFPVEMPSIG